VALVVLTASPAYATHGYETTWSRQMVLLDGVARTYRGQDLQSWRAIRAQVISDYSSVLSVRFVELRTPRYDCSVGDERRAGYVLLCSNRKDPTVGGWGGSNEQGGGAAVIKFRRLDVARYYRQVLPVPRAWARARTWSPDRWPIVHVRVGGFGLGSVA
jgi:hypothetical protein